MHISLNYVDDHLSHVPCDVKQVVIMLVIDKENDRCLLSRQSKFVPRMWSCLAGFIEVWSPLVGIL